MAVDDFSISWDAPIAPSVSLGGIPLGAGVRVLEHVLSRYVVDEDLLLYKFERGPLLRLTWHGFEECTGAGGYSFSIFNEGGIKEECAIYIMLRAHEVYAIKVYGLGFTSEDIRRFSYKGVLPCGVGLGALVVGLLPFANLEFDSAEEWFYGGGGYDGLEVSGWGVRLEDEPDQIITAMCVIPGG
ncbi:hypothetical protein SAMN05216598_4018 [Pseudomonas asplenii]|uniref:Uncharacterized protein n=1 Tax=Pseudomonas asplenii TaxID=53407 RepID=A0A1H1XQ59_9PSED|nr:hypothetical protein [Pseudomonas asplenii]SDT11407.1 hypothetical protein SAMN05216598_4018 [Pseudomonas asplenii]